MEEKKETFLDVSLIYYNNTLFLSWITLSLTTWYTKKRKIQKKKKKIYTKLHYREKP